MQGLARFLKYNNLVPITLSLLLLSFGGALAASPEVRSQVGGAVYSANNTVLSVDNTYIASKDLSSFTPRVEITGVTEDDTTYYVTYKLLTIDVKDYVWQDVAKETTMTVAKASIVGQDLGLYVTEQLKQVIDREVAYLKEVQGIERKNVSQKVVATAYGGLVGKLLDDTTETLPGYVPVIAQPVQVGQVAGASTETPASTPAEGSQPGTTTNGGVSVGGSSADQTPPSLQVLGNNPARVMVGSTYNDLGVVVTDNVNSNLGARYFVNGKSVTEVQIDTTAPGEWTVRYEATDQAGNLGFAERAVIVYAPPSGAPISQTGTSTTTDTTPVATSTSTTTP